MERYTSEDVFPEIAKTAQFLRKTWEQETASLDSELTQVYQGNDSIRNYGYAAEFLDNVETESTQEFEDKEPVQQLSVGKQTAENASQQPVIPQPQQQETSTKSIVPSFALITSHGFRRYDGYTLLSKNEMEKSVTLSRTEQDGTVRKMTLTESTYNTIRKNAEQCKQPQEQISDQKLIENLRKNVSEPRLNTSYNFRHNFEIYCQKEANNPIDAMKIAKHIISEMSPEEQKKTQALFKKFYLSKNHDYTETLIDFYKEAVKAMPIDPQKARSEILSWHDMQTEKGTLISSTSTVKIGDEYKNVKVPIKDPLSGKTKYIKDDVKVYSATESGNKVVLMNSRNELYSVARDDFLEAVNSKKERSQKHDTDLCIGR